jgi:hypothetical protein
LDFSLFRITYVTETSYFGGAFDLLASAIIRVSLHLCIPLSQWLDS